MSDYHGRHEGRHERHERGRHPDEYDNYGSEHGRHNRRGEEGYGYNEEQRRNQQGPGEERGYGASSGYAPPSGPPPSSGRGGPGFSSQGGLDRGDFASDADIDRMISTGEFGGGQGRQGYGSSGAGGERRGYDAPSGPPPGQGYGERRNEYGRYDAPSGPPGRGYQGQEQRYGGGDDRYDAPSGPLPGRRDQGQEQGYGIGGNRYDAPTGPPSGRSYQGQQTNEQDYGRRTGYDGEDQYGSQQAQGRSRYEPSQGPSPNSGYGRGQGNTPSGGFSASRDGEERHGSGGNDRRAPSRQGEAASYYNQQGGSDDRYSHLADIARENGDDPEMYRRATQGLHDKIQSQGQFRPQGTGGDYQDAHRKAYGGEDHGPMDADTIGAAAAMEAIKQTAAGNTPAGAFKSSGGGDDKEEAAGRASGGGGGMQDKLMALAMSHAGKLFDKKNAGSGGSASGDPSQGKAQAMQSAAATAMQMFSDYQSNGKVDSSKVMQLVTNMF